MYLLDTDTLSNALSEGRFNPRLRDRIIASDPDELFISAITADEMLRGATAWVNRQRGKLGELLAYAQLLRLHRSLCPLNALPFDAAAREQFGLIPSKVRQHHPQDSRIAAVALSRGFIVVTRNPRHYELIPGLQVGDWSC